jgi:hypothetical protein
LAKSASRSLAERFEPTRRMYLVRTPAASSMLSLSVGTANPPSAACGRNQSRTDFNPFGTE